MTRRFDFLDDIEDVLWDATTQTIDEALAAHRHPEHRDAATACAWCGHAWHGLACAPLTFNAWANGGEGDWAYGDCGCVNASTPIDDTWRAPAITRVDQLVHQGLDGYAAVALLEADCPCVACAQLRRDRTGGYMPAMTFTDETFVISGTRWFQSTPDAVPLEVVRDWWRDLIEGSRRTGRSSLSRRPEPVDLSGLLGPITLTREPCADEHADGMPRVMGFDVAAPPVAVPFRDGLRQMRAQDAVRFSLTYINPDARNLLFGRQPEPEPPLDPRDRAFALRRQRSSGPTRPTAGQSRRPRRHGAAR